MNEKLVGGAGHVAAAGQIDPQSLDVVGAVCLVVTQQQLESLVVQHHGGVVHVQVTQHLNETDALVGTDAPPGFDLPQSGQPLHRVLQLDEEPLGGTEIFGTHIIIGSVGL